MQNRRLIFCVLFLTLLWPMWLIFSPGGKPPFLFAWDLLWIVLGAAWRASLAAAAH